MRYAYDMYRYLIFASKSLTEDYFIEKSGAIDGYAKELFLRIYKSVFSESMDVQYLYDTFYKSEYKSFTDFLTGYYQLEPAIVEKIADTLEQRKEFEYAYPLQEGENKLEVRVYNESDVSEVARVLVRK